MARIKFDVNSSSHCFICFTKVKIEDKLVSLECIFRYLNVSLGNIKSLSANSQLSNLEVRVKLCGGCERTVNAFSELYKTLSLIKIKLNYNAKLLQKKLRPLQEKEIESLQDFNLVEELREEFAQKCHQKLSKVEPIVQLEKLSKTTIKSPKQEVVLENFDRLATSEDESEDVIVKEERLSDYDEESFGDETEIDKDFSEDVEEGAAEGDTLQHGIRNGGRSNLDEVKCEDETSNLKERSKTLITEREDLFLKLSGITKRYNSLYTTVFNALRDPNGEPYNPSEFKLDQAPDGSVIIVPIKDAGMESQLPKEVPPSAPPAPHASRIYTTKRRISRKKYHFKNLQTGNFHCTKCCKKYKSPSAVIVHYESKHLRHKYKCDICNFAVFTYTGNLAHHKKTCTGEKPVRKKPSLKIGCKRNRKRRFKIAIEAKPEPLEEKTESSPVDNPPLEEAPCSELPELEPPPKGSKPRRIFKQVFYYVNPETGLFHCTKCEKKYADRSVVLTHHRKSHFQKRFKCDICKAGFTQQNFLAHHQKSCRESLEKRLAEAKERESYQFLCSLCGKRFKKEVLLFNHQKRHTSQRNFTCDLCGKSFKHACHLKEHKEVEHLGKRFQCKFCGKAFKCSAYGGKHEKVCSAKNKNL